MLPGFFHDDQINDEIENKTFQIVRRFHEEYKRVDEQLTKYPDPPVLRPNNHFLRPHIVTSRNFVHQFPDFKTVCTWNKNFSAPVGRYLIGKMSSTPL